MQLGGGVEKGKGKRATVRVTMAIEEIVLGFIGVD